MTSEQLQSARAERWRQTANPIVTADDARAWVEEIGLCLLLPRRAHFSVPAPSFVEAVAGAPSDSTPANKDHSPGAPGSPSRDAIGQATELLHRLTAEGAVVPLNLFHAGSFGAVSGASDQPDFLATRETLPYVFSLIGGRNWKSGPGDKASPLMKEIWTLLNGEGALTAQEIQTALGRELTEAAVLRGLLELWGGLRVIPVYDGETTRWELTQARFAAEMTASQKVAQTTALSVLVSFYLQAVIAATSEEVETFLSPLTARSRVREVVNGLQATRQLGLVSVNAQPLVHVAGALPEFEEEEPETSERRGGLVAGVAGAALAAGLTESRESTERRPPERRERREEQRPFERRDQRGFERGGRQERTGPRRGYDKERAHGERPTRKPFEKELGAERGERGRGDRERFGKKRFDPGSRGFERGKRLDRERGEERTGERRERPEFRGSERRERGEFGGREERGERREFRGGKFPPKKFGKGGERPWQDRGERRGYEKPAAHREEGGRKPWESDRDRGGERDRGRDRDRGPERREDQRGSERRPSRFGGEKKFAPGKFGGSKKFRGPKKFGDKRFEGEKRFGGPKKFGSRGPSKEFEREKRPFYNERGSDRGNERGAERSSRGESRSGARFERRGERGPRQGKPEFRGTGKSKFGGKKFGERRAGSGGYKKSGFGKSGKPFGKAGKSDSGGRKQNGGIKPPFRKRKDRESESGE